MIVPHYFDAVPEEFASWLFNTMRRGGRGGDIFICQRRRGGGLSKKPFNKHYHKKVFLLIDIIIKRAFLVKSIVIYT